MPSSYTLQDWQRPSSARLAASAVVLAIAAGSCLQWWFGQPIVLAPVASVIAVTLLSSRRLPVPAAAAASLLLVTGYFLAALLLFGLSSHSAPIRPSIAGCILLAPCLAIGVDLMLGRPLTAMNLASNKVLVDWVLWGGVLVGPILLLSAIGLALMRFGEGGIAFALGGDARNHILISRAILAAGGLSIRALSSGPLLSNSVLALTMDTRHRALASPGQLLSHDMEALAALLTVSALAWSLASAGLIWAIGSLRHKTQAFALTGASLVPLTGLGLGVALRDGFFSAIFALPLFVAALGLATWSVRFRGRREGWILTWLAIVAILPIAAMTWSPMLPIEAALVCGALLGLHERSIARRTLMRGCLAVASILVTLALLWPFLKGQGEQPIAASGSIIPPSLEVFVLVPILVLAIGLAGALQVRRSVYLPYAFGTLGAGILVGYAVWRQPPGALWNYYPAKIAWLWILVSFPLLLVPAAFLVPPLRSTGGRGIPRRTAFAAVGALAALGLASVSDVVSSPLLPRTIASYTSGARIAWGSQSIPSGWDWPAPSAIDAVLRLGSLKRPLVMWNLIDPANDRLGNFWLAVYGPLPADGLRFGESNFIGWAYSSDNSDIAQLCVLLREEPERMVITRDPQLPTLTASKCHVPVQRVSVIR